MRDAETWDRLFSNWLISKGRVRADKVRFLWAEPEGMGVPKPTPSDGGVVIDISSRLHEEDTRGEITETDFRIDLPSEHFHFDVTKSVLPDEPPPALVRHAKKAKTAR